MKPTEADYQRAREVLGRVVRGHVHCQCDGCVEVLADYFADVREGQHRASVEKCRSDIAELAPPAGDGTQFQVETACYLDCYSACEAIRDAAPPPLGEGT